MALRLKSLKTRTAVALSSVIVAVLAVNAVYLILVKRGELRREIERRGELFGGLTARPICVGYETYYASGFYKFQELVGYYLSLNRDLESLRIVNVNGKILFDSAELETSGGQRAHPEPERWLEGAERLEAIKRLELTSLQSKGAAGEPQLEVIAPYIEDWGRHRLSVSYTIHYRNLEPSIQSLAATTVGLTVISMLVSVLIAVLLATRITRPLQELTAGSQGLADGHFDRPLVIASGAEELRILAETFNHMTGRLKENVSKLEESNEKLGAANEELKELDRLKSDLLANVSHELRTPLTAIKGYTDYILGGKLGPVSEKQERGLQVVQRNLERLAKSINALLDFSRMDAGRLALSLTPFDLGPLLEQIHTALRSELERKRLSFELELAQDLRPVIGDREKLSQVFENLIINAIKFTPEGGRVTVSATRNETAGRPSATVRVGDTGIGIPPAQLAKIFNRFHQVDGSATRRFGGVGLGLAIVRSILEAHGTVVEVESEVGRGTTFRFVLPLLQRTGEGLEASAPEAHRAPPRSSESLVLVGNEDPELQRAAREALEEEGLAVVTASTARECSELARRRRPDLMLLDVLLPDSHGLELLESLRLDAETRAIPVMMVSVTKRRVRAIPLRGVSSLRKPVPSGLLSPLVRRLLDGSHDGATALIVDDQTEFADAIGQALRSDGLRVQVAHDAAAALEAIGRRRPELVLLDLMLPELDGFDVLEAVAERPGSATPLIVLIAEGREAEERRGRVLEARRRASKPFDLHDVVAAVLRQIGPLNHPERNRRVLA